MNDNKRKPKLLPCRDERYVTRDNRTKFFSNFKFSTLRRRNCSFLQYRSNGMVLLSIFFSISENIATVSHLLVHVRYGRVSLKFFPSTFLPLPFRNAGALARVQILRVKLNTRLCTQSGNCVRLLFFFISTYETNVPKRTVRVFLKQKSARRLRYSARASHQSTVDVLLYPGANNIGAQN